MRLDKDTKVKFYFGAHEEITPLWLVAEAADVDIEATNFDYEEIEELCSWYYRYIFLPNIAAGGWSYSND